MVRLSFKEQGCRWKQVTWWCVNSSRESYPSGEILFSEHREGRIHLNYADHKESDAKQDLCSGKCCTFAAVISRGMLGCSGNVAGMFTFSSVTPFLVVVVFNVCFSETSSPTSAW